MKLLIGISIGIAIIGALLFVRQDEKGQWVCENGQWVARGVPKEPAPSEPCPPPSESQSSNPYVSALQKAKDITKTSYTIDYRNQGLASFPFEALDRTSAKVLDVSYNNLKSLPSEIGSLVNIEELYVNNNQLTGALPAEIRKMPALRILDARNNQLTGIPAEIGQLDRIKEIHFSNNSIDTLPNEIQNIADTLEVLDVSGNRYSPDQIQKLREVLPHTTIIAE